MNIPDQNHYQKEIATLRDRVDFLDEENRQLKAVIFGTDPNQPIVRVRFPTIHLSESEEKILYCLSLFNFTPYETIWHFLYGNRSEENQPENKIIDIFLCKIRKKIIPTGIKIEVVRGRGLCVNETDRAIIKAHSERYDGGGNV